MEIAEKNIFHERERALENEFFYNVDRKLMARLRQQLADEQTKSALTAATGISDATLLDELVQFGIKPESLAAMNLVPPVLVAWLDHRVAEKERLNVLTAAVEEGIPQDSPAYELLEHWLQTEPGPKLRQVWQHYVQALGAILPPETFGALRDEVMRCAHAVARLSHPVLGFGRLSTEKNKLLGELDEELSKRRET
jgi:hypothetical protein